MPQVIEWEVALRVGGRPLVAATRSVAVEAVDSIHVTVDVTDVDKEIRVQPGATAGDVSVLAITASAYSDLLTYKVNDSTTDPHVLNQPTVLFGTGAVELMDEAPQSLFFTNGGPEAVQIHIVAGRDATP